MSDERVVYVRIIPDVSKFQAALKEAAAAVRYTMRAARRSRSRYWTTSDGRIHRNQHMRPLLHKGRKP